MKYKPFRGSGYYKNISLTQCGTQRRVCADPTIAPANVNTLLSRALLPWGHIYLLMAIPCSFFHCLSHISSFSTLFQHLGSLPFTATTNQGRCMALGCQGVSSSGCHHQSSSVTPTLLDCKIPENRVWVWTIIYLNATPPTLHHDPTHKPSSRNVQSTVKLNSRIPGFPPAIGGSQFSRWPLTRDLTGSLVVIKFHLN